MVFRLAAAVDIACDRPSFLIPIFLSDKTNIPYVQITNEYHIVERFLPFYSIEEYFCIQLEEDISVGVEEPSLFVFRAPDGCISSGPYAAVQLFYEQNLDAIRECPLLWMQISRIASDSRAKQLDTVLNAAKGYFDAPEQRSAWYDGTAELIQSNDAIWQSIRKKETKPSREQTVDLSPFNQADFETIFRFLSSNFRSNGWEALWLKLWNAQPSDERLIVLAQRWIFSNFSPGEECIRTLNIFCAVVESMAYNQVDDTDFAEFLYDQISSLMLFSNHFPLPTRTKRKVFDLLRIHFSDFDFRRMILDLLSSNFFDKDDTLLLSSELARNLKEFPTRESESDVSLLRGIMPKLDRYRDMTGFSSIRRTLKAAIRSRSGAQ